MITKELIEQFFRDECSPEEQEQVMAYFKANPGEFAQYLNIEDWENVNTGELDRNLSKRMYEKVHSKTVKKKRNIRVIRRIAVAASVLLMAGLGFMYFMHNKPVIPVAKVENRQKDSVKYIARHEVNNTGKDKRISLEDGSLIVLSNNSEITYLLPFINSRNITLAGKASFQVAKDKTKPFTVTSAKITTTALGTQFTVTANKEEKHLTVRLYEGSVVIKAIDSTDKWLPKHVYLKPGQELIYSNNSLAIVRSFGQKSETHEDLAIDDSSYDRLLIPKKPNESYFMFNNQSLGRVLNDLGALYNVKIIYDKKDVQKIYFTGKYNKSESLETILARIATLNNLTITRKDSAFVITR